ncbi:MAG: thermonuclease family protein [Bacteriovoracaceae bacterium]
MLKNLIIVFFMSYATVWGADCVHTETELKCVEYLKNYDGDTLTINIPNAPAFFAKKAKVRINGIDSPEMRTHNGCEKKMAKLAKSFVEERLKHAKRIDLKNIGHDKYFRILASVIYDGKNLGNELLAAKLAVPYEGKKKAKVDWCSR